MTGRKCNKLATEGIEKINIKLIYALWIVLFAAGLNGLGLAEQKPKATEDTEKRFDKIDYSSVMVNSDLPLPVQWKNEYEFSATFLNVLKAKNWKLAAAMSQVDIDINSISKLIDTEDFEKANIETLYSNGQTAAAISSLLEPGQGRGRDYRLSFTLLKENGGFFLQKITQVWDGEKKFIDEFLELYPDAKQINFYPFCVYGKVTDANANPVSGTVIRASCGMGTLFQTGKTISDENGNYRLYFGPGYQMRDKDTDQWGVGFQAATIYAEKDGFYEKDLCQKGNLAMAGDAKREISVQQMKYYKGVVLPNEPYELNFVMATAASIQGKLIDEEGKPIANQKLWMSGKELYPSTNVLKSIETDQNGEFEAKNIPQKSFWFEIQNPHNKREELKTDTFIIDVPAEYSVELQCDNALADKPDLKLTSVTKTDAQIEDSNQPSAVSSQKNTATRAQRIK